MKSRARDVNAMTYAGYQIADLQTGGLVAGSGNANRGYALDLDDVETWISGMRGRQRPPRHDHPRRRPNW
jgi:hypothetical protein